MREARQQAGWTQAELARRAGITPSYVSRIEAAAWERGGPWPSDDVLRAIARAVHCSSSWLFDLREQAREGVEAAQRRTRPWASATAGARYAVSVGDDRVRRAASGLLARNPERGSIRVLSQFLEGARPPGEEARIGYTEALASKLAEDPAAVLYRVCAIGPQHLDVLRSSTEYLAGGREPSDVRNIRTRVCFAPPAALDVVVGEQEALIAAPDRRGNAALRACLVIDDPDFVAAIKAWFDEFVWEPDGDYVTLRYDRLDEAMDEVAAHLAPAGPAAPPPASTAPR